MIKINLLPEEFKKAHTQKAAFKLDIDKLGPRLFKISAIGLGVLIGLHCLLIASIFLKDGSLKRLEARWESLQPKKIEIEKIEAEIALLEKQLKPVRGLIRERLLWSDKLNQLSDIITPGIWLRRLYVQAKRTLVIEGSAAALYGDETALIARFMKALQGDKGFSRDFGEIKLGPIEKTMLEKNEIMNFTILCHFREDNR